MSFTEWWIDHSDPGPQPLTQTESLQYVVHSIGRAYGKSFAQISAGLKEVMSQFVQLEQLNHLPAPKTGPPRDPFARHGKGQRKHRSR